MHWLLVIYIVLLGAGTKINLSLGGKEIQLADLFFVLICISTIWQIKKGGLRISFFKPMPVIRSFLAFLLLFLLVSCGFSPQVKKSLLEFVAIAYLVFLYIWIGGIRLNEGRLNFLLHVWLYLSAVLCILAIGGFLSYMFFRKENFFIQVYPAMKTIIPFARMTVTFPTMNMFASFLHVSIVFLLVLIVHRGWRIKYMVLSSLLFLCVFLTGSRNLLGIFITVFLILLPFKDRKLLSFFRYIAFGLNIMLIFIVILTTVWCVFPIKANFNSQNNTLSLSINTAPSLYAILNRMSLSFIKQRFLTGVGPGMFNQEYVKHLNWDEVKDTYAAKGITDRTESIDPHNTYLGWAAEAGLPFALAAIGLFFSIIAFLWKGYRVNPDSFSGIFCYFSICGIIGFAVNGFYIDILTMRHFWLLMGLGTLIASKCTALPAGRGNGYSKWEKNLVQKKNILNRSEKDMILS